MKIHIHPRFIQICAALVAVTVMLINQSAEASTSRTCSLFAGCDLSTYTLGPATSELEGAGANNNCKHTWMLVPQWLAGTWQANSEMVLQVYDYKQQTDILGEPVTLKIQRQSVIGMQADKFGRLWHCAGVPYIRSIEIGPYLERHEMVSVVPTECTDTKVVVTCVSFVTRIDRSSGDLLSVFKEHTVTTYSPIREGLIQVTFVINDYDMKNRPIFWSKKVCTEKRIKPFQIVNNDPDRGELKLSFRRFLLEHRMADAVPGR